MILDNMSPLRGSAQSSLFLWSEFANMVGVDTHENLA